MEERHWDLNGVDERGQIRDERKQQFFGNPHIFTRPFTESQVQVIAHENVPLLNDRGEEIGRGNNLIATLWDGEEVLGQLYCLEAISKRKARREKGRPSRSFCLAAS